MALILSRTFTAGIKNKPVILYNNVAKGQLSSYTAKGRNVIATSAAGILGAGAVGLLYTLHQSSLQAGAATSDVYQHPPSYPWPHNGLFKSFDHAAIRRGYEVYKQVCSACHGLKYVRYREMVNVFLTEEEAKKEAEEAQIEDGPGEDGKMFMRPGKLSDSVPSPYTNEILARLANNGALPPDLSYITLARHDGDNYVFSILTGYTEKPAGFHLEENQHFNRFFPDGAIGMAQVLYNEAAEFSDGTPATASQMAKDVTTFLSWAASPEHDYRKKVLIDCWLVFGIIGLSMWYWRRSMANIFKSRKVIFRGKDLK